MKTIRFRSIRKRGKFFRFKCPHCNHINDRINAPKVLEYLSCTKCSKQSLLMEYRKDVLNGIGWGEKELTYFIKNYANHKNSKLAQKITTKFGQPRTKSSMENMRNQLYRLYGLLLPKSKKSLEDTYAPLKKDKKYYLTIYHMKQQGYTHDQVAQHLNTTKHAIAKVIQRMKEGGNWPPK